MDGGIATVLAALVAFAGTIVVMISQMRKENHADHGVVSAKVDMVAAAITRVEDKVDSHVVDHAKGVL